MQTTETITFSDDYDIQDDAFVVSIPFGITDAADLLDTISKIALFPDYFGRNWNALSDCLRDLHWISRRSIIINHAELPRLPRDDLKTYIEILTDSVVSWQEGEHRLTVIFPRAAIEEIGLLQLRPNNDLQS